MPCFIYFEISSADHVIYYKEKLDWVKKFALVFSVFDLDNRSDTSLKNYALQMVQQNAESVFYIEILDEKNVKEALGFLEKVARNSAKALWLLNRENKLIEFLAKQYKVKCTVVNENEKFVELVSDLTVRNKV